MIQITYSQNWNQKLDCDVHATFRLASPKYSVGSHVHCIQKDHRANTIKEFTGTIIHMCCYKLHEIPQSLALLDTGYSKEEFIKLITTMYKHKKIDFETQPWYWIFIKKNKHGKGL